MKINLQDKCEGWEKTENEGEKGRKSNTSKKKQTKKLMAKTLSENMDFDYNEKKLYNFFLKKILISKTDIFSSASARFNISNFIWVKK